MLLRTFQPTERVAAFTDGGSLVGGWEHVPESLRPAYRAMVAAMAETGVDTGGRPPVWAWWGELRLLDALSLLNPEHQLSTGYVTVEFDAPAELVVASDYGVWNDYLAALFDGSSVTRELGVRAISAPLGQRGPTQVCLPYLRADWVRDIRPLPRSGWDELDPSQPV